MAAGAADHRPPDETSWNPGSIPRAGHPARHRAPLADLTPGTRARVEAVRSPTGSAATAVRLRDLGFTPGRVVEVVRRAPLGDPVVYRLEEYELCLRRAQARYIHTEVIDR
jgi:ferrous iron transport protein A